ncbi:hypothetical protein ACMFMG_005677 [Clarireedia jacksonii]
MGRSKSSWSFLLRENANIEEKDSHGWTPLFWAAENGHKAVVRLLLENGADAETKDDHGLTLLLYATKNGRESIVQLLEGLEDFHGEELGANELDFDGECGWQPVGSHRAVGLYYRGKYTRGELMKRLTGKLHNEMKFGLAEQFLHSSLLWQRARWQGIRFDGLAS